MVKALGFSATLLAGLLTLVAPVRAEPWPEFPPTLNERQLQIAYQAGTLIGSVQLTYYVKNFDDESAARAAAAQLMQRRTPGDAKQMGFSETTRYAFAIPAPLRTALLDTPLNRVTEPVQANDRWWIALRGASNFDGIPTFAAVKDRLPEFVRVGAIPNPDDIMKMPLVQSYAAGTVTTVDTLAKLKTPYDVDMLLPNGQTLLLRALLLHNVDLIKALIAAGANPNHCASALCPLHAAIAGPDPVATTQLLLENGADPDHIDRQAGVVWSALVQAMHRDESLGLAQLLLDKHADVDGADGDYTPLMTAAFSGEKSTIQLLEQHQADWFRTTRNEVPAQTVLDMSQSGTGDAAFKEWLIGEWRDQAAKSGRYQWQAWIEQGTKRWPVNGKPITIARAPFNLVVRLQPAQRLLLASADSDAVFQELNRGPKGGRIFNGGGIAAENRDGSSTFMNLNAGALRPDDSYFLHSWGDNGDSRFFTMERQVGGVTEYVRRVDSFNLRDEKRVPIAASKFKSIYLVMGTQLAIPRITVDYFAPQRLQLQFQ
jgi:hypothetical protein